MRILVAPDTFGGSLGAVPAAAAIASGWARRRPDARIDAAPMSAGGPGFVDALHAGLGGQLLAVTVRGPFGESVPATVLLVGDTAYVEGAQACGAHLVPADRLESAGSAGVGDLIGAAVDTGARTVVVGLDGGVGGDGGAGLLAALGAVADAPLDGGVSTLPAVRSVDLSAARRRVSGVRLVLAAGGDGETPLTGMFGVARTVGPSFGLDVPRMAAVDEALTSFAALLDRRTALAPGAGAGGGLGFGLLLLGAERESGIALVMRTLGLPERARSADLVVTGEAVFGVTSRRGSVPYAVAEMAAEALVPCILLAQRVDVGAREMRALGIESAYGWTDLAPGGRPPADPAATLADLAERVARSWSW